MACGVADVGFCTQSDNSTVGDYSSKFKFRRPFGRFAWHLKMDLSIIIDRIHVWRDISEVHQFTEPCSVPRWEDFGGGEYVRNFSVRAG